ncbi:MAG: hypothetical protein KAW12_05420 [Candidatus Aminicenantes bacterium]|nr:hypothetical protein [Candidatus Aminicenantes bacterium]
MKSRSGKADLKEYISRYLTEKWQKNDVVSYSVIQDFYKHFIEAESRSNTPAWQLERSSI